MQSTSTEQADRARPWVFWRPSEPEGSITLDRFWPRIPPTRPVVRAIGTSSPFDAMYATISGAWACAADAATAAAVARAPKTRTSARFINPLATSRAMRRRADVRKFRPERIELDARRLTPEVCNGPVRLYSKT